MTRSFHKHCNTLARLPKHEKHFRTISTKTQSMPHPTRVSQVHLGLSPLLCKSSPGHPERLVHPQRKLFYFFFPFCHCCCWSFLPNVICCANKFSCIKCLAPFSTTLVTDARTRNVKVLSLQCLFVPQVNNVF